jgi:hypothetical protein
MTSSPEAATAIRTEDLEAELARRLLAEGYVISKRRRLPQRQRTLGRGAIAEFPAQPAKSELAQWAALVRTVVRDVVGEHGVIVRGLDPTLVPMLDTITHAFKSTREKVSENNIGRLIEVLLASQDPASAVRAGIDADNADARVRFMQEVACLTSAQLAEQLGHAAKNKSQTASRWKTDGKAFSVPWRGREEYPAFQFRDGRPLPVIAAVLSALPDAMTPWQIAFWFVSSNPWLDGKAPCAMLSDAEAVVRAARQEDEAVVA